MPEPKKKTAPWWEGITTKEGWQGLAKRKEPLPEPQWFTDFWKWFMGRNQQRQPTAPTAPQHFPGAPGQTYTVSPQQQARMVIEQEGGYDVLVQYDKDGNRTIVEVIGKSAQQGAGGQVPSWVTANQQAVMRTMARQYQGMEEQITKAQQRQMQAQWELQRQQMLGQLNSPGDWIKRWMLQQERNPYEPHVSTPDERAENIRTEIERVVEEGPERFRGLVDPYGEGGGEWDTETEIEISKAYQSQLKNLGKQYEQAQKVLATWGGPDDVSKKAKTPPTPPWLAQWYPQQLQTGQPIKQLPIATPSMQWWERQPESARQGWLGFAEFSGAIPMDVLSEMQRQLLQPKQPTQRSTARQRTWV